MRAEETIYYLQGSGEPFGKTVDSIRDGYSAPPRVIYVWVNNYCFFECRMCAVEHKGSSPPGSFE